ncbi:helix-turn-helix domain-containing protein, partial [candidate division WOR-3 bacterium]|nr:helix-turn-helix domain-containing protein [candidate division WOR-3 bacterium]
YTVEEVAVFLDISEQTVRKHLRVNLLKGKKIGRRWHIKGAVIRKFIEG